MCIFLFVFILVNFYIYMNEFYLYFYIFICSEFWAYFLALTNVYVHKAATPLQLLWQQLLLAAIEQQTTSGSTVHHAIRPKKNHAGQLKSQMTVFRVSS